MIKRNTRLVLLLIEEYHKVYQLILYYKNFYPKKNFTIELFFKSNKQTDDLTVKQTDSIITLSTAKEKKEQFK